jgi:nucleoside-diphosphate-sugar epimerase
MLGSDATFEVDAQRVRPENSEVERLCADNTRARAILKWQPQYDLEQGLTATIEWIRENHERYRTGVYAV